MHVPTKMDCVCGGLYRAVVGSLNKQLLDQLPPASSTAVASGSVLFCFSFFFCLLRPAASLMVGSSAMAWAASGMSRDHLHAASQALLVVVYLPGRPGQQGREALLTFLSFPCYPNNSDLYHLA